MAMTLTSSNRTVTIPKYRREGLSELIDQNIAKNYGLSGKLHVDFFNIRSGWKVDLDVITKAQYDELRAVYQDQLDNEEFLLLNDPDIPVVNLSVFFNLPKERDLSWNKSVVKDFTITLEPENANS